MTREELLAQLKDISPPQEPAWWLPAPGHWALGLSILALLAVLLAWLLRRRADRRLASAKQELRFIEARYARDPDPARLAHELAAWLKRVSLLAFPAQRLESLTGKAWLEFLDRSFGDAQFSGGAGRVFGEDIYRRAPVFDAGELLELCEQWLSQVAPRLRRRAG
jgi:Ca-activated chloride channel family protein